MRQSTMKFFKEAFGRNNQSIQGSLYLKNEDDNPKSQAIDADLDDLFDDELTTMTGAAPTSLLRSRRKKGNDAKMRATANGFGATNGF